MKLWDGLTGSEFDYYQFINDVDPLLSFRYHPTISSRFVFFDLISVTEAESGNDHFFI
jgi:hypothetical protein